MLCIFYLQVTRTQDVERVTSPLKEDLRKFLVVFIVCYNKFQFPPFVINNHFKTRESLKTNYNSKSIEFLKNVF